MNVPDERVVLITGGNKGLGFETASRLRAAGQNVYIGARDPERGQAAAQGIGVTFVSLDVTDDDSVASAAAELDRCEGRIDVLVNNAGILGPRKEVADLSLEGTPGRRRAPIALACRMPRPSAGSPRRS